MYKTVDYSKLILHDLNSGALYRPAITVVVFLFLSIHIHRILPRCKISNNSISPRIFTAALKFLETVLLRVSLLTRLNDLRSLESCHKNKNHNKPTLLYTEIVDSLTQGTSSLLFSHAAEHIHSKTHVCRESKEVSVQELAWNTVLGVHREKTAKYVPSVHTAG